jgi:hypothetical protein
MFGLVLLLAAGTPLIAPVLPSIDGKKMSIAEFEGKKVVLIHFASW